MFLQVSILGTDKCWNTSTVAATLLVSSTAAAPAPPEKKKRRRMAAGKLCTQACESARAGFAAGSRNLVALAAQRQG